jgi:predicted ester cyclase
MGTIGLFTEPTTDAYYKNLVVTEKPAGFMMAEAPQMTEFQAWTLVQPFYELFSLGGSAEKARASFAPDWQSYYSNTGSRGLEDTLGFVTQVWPQMLPDSVWSLDDLSVTTDGKIVVRGTLTGTPAGETFFGAPVTGKSISIMTLDTHTVRGGVVAESHHIEDWAEALRQLAN